MPSCSICDQPHYAKGLCKRHYDLDRPGRGGSLIPTEVAICSIPDCDKKVHSKGLCQAHYRYQKKHGTPVYVPPTAEERFLAFTDPPNAEGCWPWTGSLDSKGYGKFWDGERLIGAHIWAYEHWIGPADAASSDHTCHKAGVCMKVMDCPHRRCVNPEHLEPVTQQENVLRGNAPALTRQRRDSSTHCRNDHEYTPENTYIRPDGYRACRACIRDAMTRFRAKA